MKPVDLVVFSLVVCVWLMAIGFILIGFFVHPVAGFAAIFLTAFWLGNAAANALEKKDK